MYRNSNYNYNNSNQYRNYNNNNSRSNNSPQNKRINPNFRNENIIVKPIDISVNRAGPNFQVVNLRALFSYKHSNQNA